MGILSILSFATSDELINAGNNDPQQLTPQKKRREDMRCFLTEIYEVSYEGGLPRGSHLNLIYLYIYLPTVREHKRQRVMLKDLKDKINPNLDCRKVYRKKPKRNSNILYPQGCKEKKRTGTYRLETRGLSAHPSTQSTGIVVAWVLNSQEKLMSDFKPDFQMGII